MVPQLQERLEGVLLCQCPEEIQLFDAAADKDGERDLAALLLANLSGVVSQPGHYCDPGSAISRERARSKAEYV